MANLYPFHGHSPQIDPGAFVADTATIVGDVTIKKGANIWPGVVIRANESPIVIGEGVNIQDNTVLHTDPGSPMILDDYCMIGHKAIIHGRHIGSGTLVGMGVILMGETDIGDSCLIGAGTMITQNKVIPPRSLVYGTPFRIVRSLEEEEIKNIHEDIMGYYRLGQEYKALQDERNRGK